MLTREQAAKVLAIPAGAGRPAARAAMLVRLHELLAAQGLTSDSDAVMEVEDAYLVFSTEPPTKIAPVPARQTHRQPLSAPAGSPKSPKFWVAVLIVGLLVLTLIGALSGRQSNDSGSNPSPSPAQPSASTQSARPTAAPRPSRTNPDSSSGVTGEVGTCWAESIPDSGQFRKVSCTSPSADVRVSSETRSARECRNGYFESGGGWYLCLARL